MRVIERKKEHYETQEVPYGKVYSWRSERVLFECGCGETLIWQGGRTECGCGASYEEFGREVVEPSEARKAYRPWLEEYEAWREAKAATGLQHEYYGFVGESNDR
ncbi:MAG: hypothetical protein ACFB50_02330 [Rubrobacteraceae bacterium]